MKPIALALAAMSVLAGVIALQPTANALSNEIYARVANYFIIRCNVFLDNPSCTAGGCYWWSGICNSMPAGVTETDYCIKLDEELQLCFTNINTKYVIVNMGTYGEAVNV